MTKNKNIEINLEKHSQELKKFTEDLLSFFEINATVSLNLSSDYSAKLEKERSLVQISLDVPEFNSLLIGKGAKSLYSFQSIVAAYSRKNFESRDLTIQLDIGGYRKAMEERFLKQLEQKVQTVLQSSEDLEVGGLSSLERRLAHNYISKKYSDKLSTKSTGIGNERKLTISSI